MDYVDLTAEVTDNTNRFDTSTDTSKLGISSSENTASNLIYQTQEALRKCASLNLFRAPNFRFRGHREAHKFNYVLQEVITNVALILNSVKTNSRIAEEIESNVYPEEDDIAQMYHVLEQLKFKEWLLLKDDRSKWYF